MKKSKQTFSKKTQLTTNNVPTKTFTKSKPAVPKNYHSKRT